MLKNYLLKLWTDHLRRFREQKGQSIIIFTFAVMGLIAMMGLALDLGLVYIERVRISRTTDAATLAAVVELPFEEEAMQRAIEYIELNGYTVGDDTEVRVRGCIDVPGSGLANVGDGGAVYNAGALVDIQPDSAKSGYVYRPALGSMAKGERPRAVFVIDTLAFQPVARDQFDQITTVNSDNCDAPNLYGTANKIRVSGGVDVDMNFMQFFGWDEFPVTDNATAENVTNLDVVVVFDVSGSMRFETNCFGCWNKNPSLDIINNPYPTNGTFNPLTFKPSGTSYDIFWDGGSAGHPLCADDPDPIVVGTDSYHYLVHEAEFYSVDSPLHGWEFDKRNPGQGFWVLQRTNRGSNASYIRTHPYPVYSQTSTNDFPQLQGASYNSECFDAPDYECWKTTADALGEKAPSTPPWVEYDFTPDWSDNTHIWIRAQGGNNYSDKWNGADPATLPAWKDSIYWQVDLGADQFFDPTDPDEDVWGGPFPNLIDVDDWTWVAEDVDWRWVKLGEVDTTAGTRHTLKLYQGSAGFNVDKIIFTNDPYGSSGTVVSSLPNLNSYGSEGPEATDGSATREACNKCNPVFGQTVDPADCSCRIGPNDTTVGLYPGGGTAMGCTSVTTTTNQLSNDLFHGEDPLRSAKEAVKKFAMRLSPRFDQIGFVAFTNDIRTPRTKLQCLRYATQGHAGSNGVADCFDPSTNPISFTNVIRAVEAHNPTSSTDISEGMREGLEELGISTPGNNVDSDCSSGTSADGDGHACDRHGAARRILILLTDGSPNQYLSTSCTSYQWRGRFGQDKESYDCAMYYASQAADNNVTVYTIGIGSGVNIELLTAMASGTDPNPRANDDGFYFEGRGGRYYPAAKPSDLDAIFEDILSNIYVRIVG